MSSLENYETILGRDRIKRPKKYSKYHQPLSKEDYDVMFADIKENGQAVPVDIDEDYNLLDGYTRDEMLGKIDKLTILVTYHKFSSEAEKITFIKSRNRNRRHLTPYQKCQWAKPLYDKIKKTIKPGPKSESQDAQLGKATERAAKSTGVSTKTFERFITIENSDEKEKYKKDLETGKKQIKTVSILVTRKQRNLPKIPLPKTISDVFLGDVPYGYKDQGGRAAAEEHYPTMTPQEIREEFKNLPAADNAVFFFWMSPSIQYDEIPIQYTNENQEGCAVTVQTPVYKAVLDAAGFKVKAEFVWDKEKIGVGSYNRNQHENLLFAIKGKMPVPAELFSSIIKQLRSSHSRKPNLWPMIKKMYPKRNYCELYAREKTEGVLCHGNQVKKELKLKTRTSYNCKFCGTVCKNFLEHLKKYHAKSIKLEHFPKTEKGAKGFFKSKEMPI